MPLLWRRHLEVLEDRKCSFCHKHQDVVGPLISNPIDYPRAFICNECVSVCGAIIKDPEDPISGNPLVSQFLAVTHEWTTRESQGQDASEQLSRLRSLARLIFPGTPRAD